MNKILFYLFVYGVVNSVVYDFLKVFNYFEEFVYWFNKDYGSEVEKLWRFKIF